MAEHHGESPEEEHQATCHQVVVYGGDDASHDESQAGDAHAWHEALDGWETLLLAVDIVEQASDGHGDNRDDEDVEEHSHGIHMDNLACRELHQQRCHHRGEDGGGAGHPDGESHVAMAEVAHDVARHAARATAHEEDAEGEGRVEMPDVYQQVSHAGHDDELGAGSDEDVERSLCQNLEIVGGESQSHGEHDDAEDDGLCGSAHPVEGMWEEECEHCYTDDENRGVVGQPFADPLQ